MQYLLHDLLKLPIADRLLIIERAISSTLTEGEERFRQIQKQLNHCNLKNGNSTAQTQLKTNPH